MSRLSSAFSGFALLVACNAILGNEEPVRFEGGSGGQVSGGGNANGGDEAEAGAGAVVGAGGNGATGGSDSGTAGSGMAGEAGSHSTGGGGSEEAPCDPDLEADEAIGVFVAPDGSDAAGDGSMLQPYQTISHALVEGDEAGKQRVYIAAGTYPEALNIGNDTGGGMVMEGGFTHVGANWSKNCDEGFVSATVIASPEAIGVFVSGTQEPTGVEHLTIATKPLGASANDEHGESVYGVFVTGDDIVFHMTGVEVVAGDGGDGGAVTVVPEQTGSSSCTGYENCSSDPNPPASDPGGAGADQDQTGSFGPGGYGALAGSPGESGEPGPHGQIGTMGEAKTCWACTCHGCGQPQCESDCTSPATAYGPQGKCGCGGLGGDGGSGGPGGGASIAFYLAGTNASAALSYVTLAAGTGGDGAMGGDGGLGGDGAAPEAVGDGYCPEGCYDGSSCPGTGCNGRGSSLSPGLAGTAGHPGGEGGPGGGGTGGPAWALVIFGGGTVTEESTSLSFQAGGVGYGSAAYGTDGFRLEVP